MNPLKPKVNQSSCQSLADHIHLSNQIEHEIKKLSSFNLPIYKIAILATSTIQGIKETLNVKCVRSDIYPKFYVAPYQQVAREILNPESDLYKFQPDLTILFIDVRFLMGDHFFYPYRMSDDERRKMIQEKIKESQKMIEVLKTHSRTKILIHNFEVPTFSPMGFIDSKQSFGLIESIETLNHQLRSLTKDDPDAFVFDFNAFCSAFGKKYACDLKLFYLADIQVSLDLIPDLCNGYMAYIKTFNQKTKKCIVLDLDQTLWGGILGEDGIEGIKLGPDPEGRSFWEFQKTLLSLHERGIILAINSKNNLDEVMEVFDNHPHMILKERHFASIHVNWNDKITNMQTILEEINIGENALIFIDDDPLNREMIRKSYPEIMVVDLPKDASQYVHTLQQINDLNILQWTDEDKKRGQNYFEQKKRTHFKKQTLDLSTYLGGLETVVSIKNVTPFLAPRVSQLTLKTNQFNLSNKKYDETDIHSLMSLSHYLVLTADVRDKFGDNGTCGMAIIQKKNTEWHLDSFLMSCRVLGRKIEESILAFILDHARRDQKSFVTGSLKRTVKNIPAQTFYANNGFKLRETIENTEIWEFDLEQRYDYPQFIEIKE